MSAWVEGKRGGFRRQAGGSGWAGNIRIVVAAGAALLLAAGCVAPEEQQGASPAPSAQVKAFIPDFNSGLTDDEQSAEKEKPDHEKPDRKEQERLLAIKQRLTGQLEALEERHSIRVMSYGVGAGHIMMQVRKQGDVEQPISAAELEAIRATVLELGGEPFELQLGSLECCRSEAAIAGVITAKEPGRVLVVNEHKKNGNTDDPEAFWLSLADDGKIIGPDGATVASIDDLAIGREVRAWTNGLVLQSYPAQTQALKIEVVE